jgi:branched-chain amino acid transport system ATP-binding protein
MAVLAMTVAVVAVLAALPGLTTQYGLLVAFQVAQLAALAQAWNLMAGYGGMVSLAVAAFVGAGSYGTAKLSAAAGLGVLPSIGAGGVVAVLFALAVSVPMFRFRALYFTVASLVLAQALAIFMSSYNGLGGNQGVFLSGSAPSQREIWFLSAGTAVAATLAVAWLASAKLGLGLRSIRDDEDVAERVGVTTFRTKLASFTVAAFVMGVVGGIQAQRTGYVEPSGAFALDWTIETVNAAIIGGIGTVAGPLAGAAISVGLSQWLARYPEIHLMILGVLLIVIIRLAPAGLWGLARQLAGRAAARMRGRVRAAPRRAQAPGTAPPRSAPSAPEGRRGGAARAPGGTALRATGVGKTFGGVRAVDGVSLELRPGEVLGIVGPNGAGKSTLIGLLSGAISGQGDVELFGEQVTAIGAQGRTRRGMGRTHQVPRPFRRMTVLENLLVAQRYGARAGRKAALAEARAILARCGLGEFAGTQASELGLLRLKRLELARALAVRPRVLLLDEIGAGLTAAELRELIELIQSLRGEVEAILIVEHVLDVIRECCDRLLVLDRGRLLASGAPEEVLRDQRVAAVYLGTSGAGRVRRGPAGPGKPAGPHRAPGPLLEVKGIAARYGSFRALEDVSFSVAAGEVVALLGANGAGKTTTARAISGMLPVAAGEIWFAGQRTDRLRAHQVVQLGLAHCLEGRRVFGDLTVQENLLLGARSAAPAAERSRRLGSVCELFPVLRERRGSSGATLSGGEQQMLAIGRALMAAPRLVIFDEISLGLAPVAVDRLYQALAEINAEGTAMIVIEQNVERGLALADHVAVLEKGRVALAGAPADIRADQRLLSLYVGEAKDPAGGDPLDSRSP